MKTPFNFCIFALLTTVAVICRAQTANIPPPTPYSVISRSASERIWERTIYEASPSGQTVPRTQKYTELGDGICYFRDGQWLDSQDEIDLLSDGSAGATNGPLQVFFPPDLGSGTIKLVSPEGLQIEEQPAILCYDDGSNTVIIAVLTNSIGQLIEPNKIIYPGAFFGTEADILYTYGKGGRFEQDVILRERPPDPGSLGLNPQTTSLKVLTQFFGPQPRITSINAPAVASGIADENLEFGSVKMIPGRAFLLGTNQAPVRVAKQWIQLDGKQFLAESVPVAALADGLSTLRSAARPAPTRGSLRRLLTAIRPEHPLTGKTRSRFSASRTALPSTGLTMDFATITGGLTNYVFQGDSTYYISGGQVTLFGTNTFEGGTVIKYGLNGAIVVEGSVQTLTSAYGPVIFTSMNNNTVGNPISGSTGNPNGEYANPALLLESTELYGLEVLSDLRIENAQTGIEIDQQSTRLFDIQVVNCNYGCEVANCAPAIGNALFANDEYAFSLNSCMPAVMNATFSGIWEFATGSGGAMYVWNCAFANVSNVGSVSFAANSSNNGFYNAHAFGLSRTTNDFDPFQTVGDGSYYLATNCAFRGAGTTTNTGLVLADLQTRTTQPPWVYNQTNVSYLGTLGPQAPRDTNNAPDLGYHYPPLDYLIGGCDLSNSLTFTTGTVVGWFEETGAVSSSSQPYGISLDSGANLSFNGNATHPCIFARYTMAQEGQNGIWTNSGSIGGIMFNGGSPTPQLSANFTKFSSDDWNGNLIRDNSASGDGAFKNCEFYNFAISTYGLTSLTFTNSLFFRFDQDFSTSPILTFENCTFYNGGISLSRSSPVSWLIENCSFDGTAFKWSDIYNGASYTTVDHNAYNTNNLSWQTNSLYTGYCGTNEVVGSSDLMVSNYNWESSWFGNFYLPTNSQLIGAGSTYANLVGLYHFTTVTNQIPDGTNIVTIGYHYVATDQYGNPLDSNGDGIPDYLEDPAGNGSGNWNTTMFLNVIISQPKNGSTLP